MRITPFDIAEHLETDEDIKLFLKDAAETGTANDFIHALNTAARAKGMTRDSQTDLRYPR
ncbi:DNA-binding protein [Methylomonas sp. HYX-M1]|uniref:helix-turn-helix domain-containing transcriptional regulator n=1 Tax=Methylomonas sp. HYX-M1 TaxID=3139307 RepID=UPI00345BCA46